jgi:hypothetical protein
MNSMTVAELIALLQTMPQDAPVIYPMYSEYTELRPDEVRLIKAEDKRIVWREQNGYMYYYPSDFAGGPTPKWNPNYKPQYANEQPKFVTVVMFPGN